MHACILHFKERITLEPEYTKVAKTSEIPANHHEKNLASKIKKFLS
jgi:hypothetical protein